MRWGGHVAYVEEERKVYKVLVGRPRHKWEDGIRMDLREIGWGGGVWMAFDWLRKGTGGELF
jgi:hypothetical protein